MKTLALASGNAHKLQEFSEILSPLGWRVLSIRHWLPSVPEPDETEADFQGNALLKARFALEEMRSGTIADPPDAVAADDSGLAVDVLGGSPGVYSARYAERAGRGSDDAANRLELVRNLSKAGVPYDAQAPAAFVCAIAFVPWNGGEGTTVEARCPGVVGLSERGEGGFGYDSLFRPLLSDGKLSDRTFAEMSSEAKHDLSHRGLALRELVRRLA